MNSPVARRRVTRSAAAMLVVSLVAMGAAPAGALLPPQPRLQWHAGYQWSLAAEGSRGLDWGLGVYLPLQLSSLGLVSAFAQLEGAPHELDRRVGGVLDVYRYGRSRLGAFYTLRTFEAAGGIPGEAVQGLGLRLGDTVVAYYPSEWNPGPLTPGQFLLVVEPAWFSGLYLRLRYIGDGPRHQLKVALGLEEDW